MIVLDASAILAVILTEPGAEIVGAAPDHLVTSTVNLAECISRIDRVGGDGQKTLSDVMDFVAFFEPASFEDAVFAGSLAAIAKPLGLSLADRFCLALASRLGAEVYCADNRMAELDIGLKITRIREPREKKR